VIVLEDNDVLHMVLSCHQRQQRTPLTLSDWLPAVLLTLSLSPAG
jgi:hypothetical protein